MKSFLVKLVWRFCSGWFVPNSEELYIAAVNLTMNDGERLYVLWSLVYCWDHNIQSCLSESVSESYSSLSEYRRLGFFPTLADLQPSVSWTWTWRTAQTRLGDVSLSTNSELTLGLEAVQALCLLYSVILSVSFLPIVFLPSPLIGIVWKSEVA